MRFSVFHSGTLRYLHDALNHAMDAEPLVAALFTEPAGYYAAAAEGKEIWYDRGGAHKPSAIRLRLAAKHSLWAHELWNAARLLSGWLDEGKLEVRGMSTLEMGAGAGLPSLLCALNGAACVCATDYGTDADPLLIKELRANADWLAEAAPHKASCSVRVLPHIWGTDCTPVLAVLPPGAARFDRLLLCDLLFNRQSHVALVETICTCLAPQGRVWCAFSHHDPLKAPLDLAFFDKASAAGLAWRKVSETAFERDLFEEGDGMDAQRAVVLFYELSWAHEAPVEA